MATNQNQQAQKHTFYHQNDRFEMKNLLKESFEPESKIREKTSNHNEKSADIKFVFIRRILSVYAKDDKTTAPNINRGAKFELIKIADDEADEVTEGTTSTLMPHEAERVKWDSFAEYFLSIIGFVIYLGDHHDCIILR